MKIIDLLNKIANGEDIPKKIKVNNIVYEYRGYMYCTENPNYQDIEDYLFGKWNFNILNNEIEIIEEDKKIEKIDLYRECPKETRISKQEYLLESKINEIIDKLNEGDKQ